MTVALTPTVLVDISDDRRLACAYLAWVCDTKTFSLSTSCGPDWVWAVHPATNGQALERFFANWRTSRWADAMPAEP